MPQIDPTHQHWASQIIQDGQHTPISPGGSVSVTDGTTTVAAATQITMPVGTVSNPSPGVAAVSVGSSHDSTATGTDSIASGNYSTATGTDSIASGNYSTATGDNSVASGIFSLATAYDSVASGNKSSASGNYSVASGYGASARASYSVASAYGGDAYSPGQVADIAEWDAFPCQQSRVLLQRITNDATPKALTDYSGGNFTFQTAANASVAVPDPPFVDDYKKTALVHGRIVARRTDTPGTDSAWDFAGVIRGDGSTAYSWVGGSAPVPAVIAQDAGASTWAVAVTISGASIVVTATGETGKTIHWMSTLELDEMV